MYGDLVGFVQGGGVGDGAVTVCVGGGAVRNVGGGVAVGQTSGYTQR